ncbi:hypothetical protein V4B67_27220, partial [Klebsiella pneumoniae]
NVFDDVCVLTIGIAYSKFLRGNTQRHKPGTLTLRAMEYVERDIAITARADNSEALLFNGKYIGEIVN